MIMDHGRQVFPENTPPLTFKLDRYSNFVLFSLLFNIKNIVLRDGYTKEKVHKREHDI